MRTDFIMYRPWWGAAHYNIGMLDWRPEEHWRLAGYGRVILLFKAVILNAVHSLAFIEVLYPVPVDAFQTEVGQIVNEEHGNVLLYGGAPARTYEVINTSEILGPVPIMRHPSQHTIPHGALVKDITHGAGDTEVGMGQGDGLHKRKRCNKCGLMFHYDCNYDVMQVKASAAVLVIVTCMVY